LANVFDDDDNNMPRPNVVAQRFYGQGGDRPGIRQGKGGGLGIRQGKGFRDLMTTDEVQEGDLEKEEEEEGEE
jgi:hypothetical protein